MKKDKRKRIIAAEVVVLVICCVAVGSLYFKKQPEDAALADKELENIPAAQADKDQEAYEESGSDADQDGSVSSKGDAAGSKTTKNGTGKTSANAGSASDTDSSMPDGTEWRTSTPSASGSTAIVKNEGSEVEKEEITFPYTVPNSNLVIQSISGYDGIFLEDGSDSNISGVASAVVKNSGKTAVEYAKITITSGDGTLEFQVSDVPSGAYVVAQEVNKASYKSAGYTDCTADVAELSALEMSGDKVKVEENEDGSLTVSNLTDKEIPCVRVFYKFYMDDEDAYVGGITYNAKLTGLTAGGSQKVVPSHYSAGYSKVVMVRTYDTAD